MNATARRQSKHLRWFDRLTSLGGGLIPGWYVLLLLSFSPSAPGHERNTHQTIADYAAQKAASLPTPVNFTTSQRALLQQGAYDEDNLTPLPRPRDHGFNPITDSGFVGNGWFGSTARNAIVDRWNSMTSAFVNGNFDGGDNAGAWHFLGRASHLMQDMTSPLHSMAVWHDGVVNPVCQFEGYWSTNDASLRTTLSSIGGPLHSSTLDAKATERLDSFTATRLQDRFNNSSPNKSSDDPRGWVETMVWATYFRATFWGQVTMGDSVFLQNVNGPATSATTTSTTFSDGTVGSQVNVLESMFGNGNVRWINNYIGDDYYEITDRLGNVFRFMSFTDIDDWAACGEAPSHDGWAYGQRDASIRANGDDDDSDNVRVTGRFWFDLRELGKSTSGTVNRYCYPRFYPNGDSMTEHLHQYFGNYLDPLAVRYNAGLLGLANRRVTVNTADSTPANGFSWGRRDNFGNGLFFNAASDGSNFFFVAKSQVSLTAPSTNSSGRAFVRWLRDGSTFSGDASRTITINTTSAWIPESGVVYTAEYEIPVVVNIAVMGPEVVISWRATVGKSYIVEFTDNLSSANWSELTTILVAEKPLMSVTDLPVNERRFYRIVQLD
jgi:hypothetical protein